MDGTKPRKRVKINIAGQIFRTYEDTLDRMPDTLLGNRERRNEYFDDEAQEFFFDRHRESFPAILYFYQSDGIMGKSKILLIECINENKIHGYNCYLNVRGSDFENEKYTICCISNLWETT